MKRILSFFVGFVLLVTPAFATPQLGISPCQIAQQPGDVSVSGVSTNVHLSTCGETLILINNSTSDFRFRLGTASNTTALTTDLLLPQKTMLTINVGINGLYLAVISTGSGTLSLIQGTAE